MFKDPGGQYGWSRENEGGIVRGKEKAGLARFRRPL